MKKIFTLFFTGIRLLAMAQSTATDFTCNDCNGTSHHLFSELDAGKVIVICWVMPCGTCVSPALTTYNTVQSFQTSYPNRVYMYLVDDYANSSCSTINNWATTNNMPNTTKFSNPVINMSDYGGAGMPKVVVLGGTSHTVFYNANNSVNQSALQTAILNALNATSSVTEPAVSLSRLNIFPNPAVKSTEVSYWLDASCSINIEIYNMAGEKVSSVFSGTQSAGAHAINVNLSGFGNGIYFVKLTAGRTEKTVMFSVLH